MEENSTILSQIIDEVDKGGVKHIVVGDKVIEELNAMSYYPSIAVKAPEVGTINELYGIPCTYDAGVDTYICESRTLMDIAKKRVPDYEDILDKTIERGELMNDMDEVALRDFLYDIAYENIQLPLGQKLYEMLEEEKVEGSD